MPLRRSDLDQAIRYLTGASEAMERAAGVQTRGLRDVLAKVIQRLSPGNNYVGDAPAEITVLRQAAARRGS